MFKKRDMAMLGSIKSGVRLRKLPFSLDELDPVRFDQVLVKMGA